MPDTKRPLKVFLCHAHSDRENVKVLYERLVKDGVDAWLDKQKLLPGQDWELEIRKAVRECDVIVVCLSKQFNNAGFRQKEVRLALDTAMEKPEGGIFIIPARLEVCENLESLKKWHWVDLFEENGYDMLMRALRARADSIEVTLQANRSRAPEISSPHVKSEKHIEEDQSIAPPSAETPAKKADSNAMVESPRIPSIAARKLFKPKTEYIVAMIGAVAMIIAAVINSPLIERWFTQKSAPTASVTTQVSALPTESSAVILPTETLPLAPPNASPSSAFQAGDIVQHQVIAGESLFVIARCYGADFENVRDGNPHISDPGNVATGMTIVVPNIGSVGEIYGPPCLTYYTVQSGDTWQSIAQKHDADLMILQTLNPGALQVGSVLYIPRFQEPRPLTFPQGSTTVRQDGTLRSNEVIPVPLHASKGDMMSVKVTATGTGPATMGVFNSAGWTIKPLDNTLVWNGTVPETGDYRIVIMSISASINYTLDVSLTSASQ